MTESLAGFTRHEVQIASGRCVWWQAGSGPAVWCLHGFPDTAGTWQLLAADLVAQGYTVYVPHMPGYLPENALADYSVPTLAQTLLALMHKISPDGPVRVVGHDWGAVCAYAMAALEPEFIQRMVCAAVPHLRRFLRITPAQLQRSWYMGFFQLPYWPERRIAADQQAFIERLWRDWSPGWRFTPEEFSATRNALADPQVCRAALAYYRAMPRTLVGMSADLRRQMFAPTRVPTLAIAGAQDGCIGAPMFADQEACFSSTYQLLTMPQAGHFMHREQPQEFSQAVRDFFA